MNERDKYIKELITSRDELERKVDERTLELTNEIVEREKVTAYLLLLEKAFMTTTTGITFSDTDRNIRFMNNADAKMHGYEKDELIGKHTHILSPEELWHDLTKEEITIISGWSRESVNIRKDGTRFPVYLISDSVIDDEGKPLGIITTCEDITHRKKAKADLDVSERKYRTLLEYSPLPTVITNLSGQIEYLNNRFTEVLGYTIDDIRFPKQWWAAAYPDEQYRREVFARWGKATDKARNKGEDIVIDTHYVTCKDGSVLVMELWGVLIADKLMLQCHDITASKKAKEEAMRAKEEWERTFNSITDPIMILDAEHKVIKANTTMAKIFGVTPDKAVGLICYKEVHGAGCPIEECPHQALLKDSKSHEVEIYEESMGGHFLVSVSPIFDTHGNLTGSVHIARDINERKTVEEKIKTSQQRLANAQAIARLGSWDWDIVNNALEWSDEVYRIFGLTPQDFEATYEAFINTIHPDDREFVALSVDEALSDKKPYSIDHRIILPDGTERVVHEQAEVTFDENGNPVSMSGTVQDITERKIAEQQTQKSLYEKEALLAEIHHRVKNNMAVISSLLSLQSTKVFANEDKEMFMDSISRIRSMALVHEKLYRATDFTDIDFSGYLDSLINEIMNTCKVSKSKVSVSVKIDKGLILPIDISIPLGLLINELLVNTIKHAFPADTEGKINVSLQHVDDNTARLVVKDNGVGIPGWIDIKAPDSLGLRLVNSLVAQLDGEISLECHKGTEFCIVFSKEGYKKRI
jgi:PAS domain S-box-containing protein